MANVIYKTAHFLRKSYDLWTSMIGEYFGMKLVSITGHTEYQKFIILSGPRTGSSLLATFLDSHPNMSCNLEIFHTLSQKDYMEVLGETYPKLPGKIGAKGFKMVYGQPMDNPTSEIWNTLANMEDVYVIHLFRRDMIRQVVSWYLASETNVWVKKSEHSQDRADTGNALISITPEQMRERLKIFHENKARYSELFKNRTMITLFFEDLTAHPYDTLREVTDFINQPYARMSTELRKQNPHDLSDILENYEELKSAFANTEYAWSFDT